MSACEDCLVSESHFEAMGLWMSRLLSMFGEKEARILVLGLDNAGKTTILCESHLCLHIAMCYVVNLDAVR